MPPLRSLREQAGLTREQLAHKAGLTSGVIYKLETGRARPRYDTVVKIAEALGVSIAEIELPERRTSGG
jgi:transcriptional regulator with XRE-family HTH domain